MLDDLTFHPSHAKVELDKLYNYRKDESNQFNRHNMEVAIYHGMRVADQRHRQRHRQLVAPEFIRAILHGDSEHRAWLKEAARCYNNGQPIPPPRAVIANRRVPLCLRMGATLGLLVLGLCIFGGIWNYAY